MNVLFMLSILGSLIPIIVIGLIIYGIIVWRRRASAAAPDTHEDPGIGTVRRLYFYIVSFVSLMMAANGITMLAESILDAIVIAGIISDSAIRIAAGASLTIVGLPLWFFHWRFIQRVVRDTPVETRSILRKLYIYLALAVAGGFIIYNSFHLLQWIFGVGDFSGYNIAAVIIWSAVWAVHWFIEERERQSTQSTPETLAIRRLYIYIAALTGLVMLSFGIGRIIYFILLEGYIALTYLPVISGESGLWRPALRGMLSVSIIGLPIWILHWLYIARRDYGSALRQVYLYIFAILGGVTTTLSAIGIIIHETLVWAFNNFSADSTAEHFEFLPGAIALLSVGAALWAYHWHRVRHEADETSQLTGALLSARRAYTYIMAAIGTALLAVSIFILVSAVIRLIAGSFSDAIVLNDQWKSPIVNIITLTVLGVPIWGYYWQTTQQRRQSHGPDEILAISRRIFLFAALGVGVLSLLGSVSVVLFVLLRDLLELSLTLDTVNSVADPIAVIAAVAAFLPYYWSIYRQDQQDVPESAASQEDAPVSSEPAEKQRPTKMITLLASADSGTLAQRIEDALNCDVNVLRWTDANAFTPALTDAELTLLAQRVADTAGEHILLIPDGDRLRVLSHD